MKKNPEPVPAVDEATWQNFKNAERNNPGRKDEMSNMRIKTANNLQMRFKQQIFGNKPKDGYTLFICLHGGGGCPTYVNDSQWKDIIPFLQGGFKEGCIAVAPRGVNDTWNLHFNDESYPAYARLIEDFIIFYDVNPNKVYLIGFSAGGDGTYQVVERIPHLLAACSPQAGHPNDVSVINQGHVPMYMAVGEKDSQYKRNSVILEHLKKINGCKRPYYAPYTAKAEIVQGSGHSFQCWKLPRMSRFDFEKGNKKTNDTAFTFLYSFTRNPYPTELCCDTKTFLTPLRNHFSKRGDFYYYLEMGKKVTPTIKFKIDFEKNTAKVIEGDHFRIWCVSKLFKKGDTVTMTKPTDKSGSRYTLQKDPKLAEQNLKLLCDPYYAFDSYIPCGTMD
ncbi:MAG: hypothetical protein MJ252_31000 [archaeon]|nr:hypothetical protein [archaeon]